VQPLLPKFQYQRHARRRKTGNVHICDSERETATRLVQNDTSMTLSTCTLESTTRVRLRALSCFRDSVERERGGLAVTQNSTLMTYTASTVVFLCDRESLQRGARLDDPSLSLEERERDSRGERERRTLYSLRLERAPPPSEPSDGVHRTSVRTHAHLTPNVSHTGA